MGTLDQVSSQQDALQHMLDGLSTALSARPSRLLGVHEQGVRLADHLHTVNEQSAELSSEFGRLRMKAYGPLAGIVEILNLHHGSLEATEDAVENLQRVLAATEK